MSSAYSPQRHALAVDESNELLRRAVRELAALRGDVARLLATLPTGTAEPDGALDALILAAHGAMGSRTWITAELVGRSLHSDPAAAGLSKAIRATGRGDSTRSLGKYLATRVPAAYVTDAGLELRRVGIDGNVIAWTIAKV